MSLLPHIRTRPATGVDCLELGLSLHHKWSLTEFVWLNFGVVIKASYLVRGNSDDY